MSMLFTVGFLAIFIAFVLAAFVGHVLLAAALTRPYFRHIGLPNPTGAPEQQPAATPQTLLPYNATGTLTGRLEPAVADSPFPASLVFASGSNHLADRAPTH